MIRITIENEAAIEELRQCYANKLNTISMGARRKANSSKRRFKGIVAATSKIEGRPVSGSQAILIVWLCLPRCDVDAPSKAIQDAIEHIALKSKNDGSIKYAWTYLVRPSKRAKRKRFIVAECYDARTESAAALARSSELLGECVRLSGHACL